MLPQFDVLGICQTDVLIIEKLRKYIAVVVSINKKGQLSYILCDSNILLF
jgi:hypothetical protein